MRKVIQSFSSSKNIKTLTKCSANFIPISKFKLPSTIHKPSPFLTYRPQYYISNDPQVTEQQPKVIVPYKGYLTIRNSQNMDMAFETGQKVLNIIIPKASTIDDVKELVKGKLNANTVEFACEQAKTISGLTPFEALLDRNVFMVLDGNYSVKIQGELLRASVNTEDCEKFRNLEIPLTTRREIEAYCKRVNTWIEAKYGAGFENSSIKIPKAEAKKILIQALVDPLESNKRLLQKQEQFQKLYWEVQGLQDKKSEAVVICSKMVRARMSLGLFLILGNVLFIWAGTYIFYSWDIIEPIAYFLASFAGIILCSRFFKIKRPFSLQNYRQYMLKKYMEPASKKVGVNLAELEIKRIQLAELEAEIKDYYLKRL